MTACSTPRPCRPDPSCCGRPRPARPAGRCNWPPRRRLRRLSRWTGRPSADAGPRPSPPGVARWPRPGLRWRRSCRSPCGPCWGRPASIPEIRELQGDAEVLLLQRRDHRLQVVSLLAGHPHLLALGLRRDALGAFALDEAVDGPGLIGADARLDGDGLPDGALGRLLDLSVVERLERHVALDELLLEDLHDRFQPVFGGRVQPDLLAAQLDGRTGVLEVEPRRDLAAGLV